MIGDIVTGAILAILVLGNAGLYLYHRSHLDKGKQNYADLVNRLLEAERTKQRTESELEFLKGSVVQMLQKPILATMTDVQVSQMVDTIMSYTKAQKDPAKLN